MLQSSPIRSNPDIYIAGRDFRKGVLAAGAVSFSSWPAPPLNPWSFSVKSPSLILPSHACMHDVRVFKFLFLAEVKTQNGFGNR